MAAILRSQPAQKLPPPPQNTAALAVLSSKAMKASAKAAECSASTAFLAWGRSWMMVQTSSVLSMETVICAPPWRHVAPGNPVRALGVARNATARSDLTLRHDPMR